MQRNIFSTTSRGLDRTNPAMRLFEKAKLFGIWNPSLIDLFQDKIDWNTLDANEKDVILRLTAMFQAGEEAVTLDLLPLILTIAREGKIEEEIFMTSFLWEEAKHTDFFRRFLDEIVLNEFNNKIEDLGVYHTENYKTIFYINLPQALNALLTDQSTKAQVCASVTYNLIVEGVLAETGYHAFFSMLEKKHIMPGLRKGISLIKQDESRHIAYGIFLLSRLIAADDNLWNTIEETMKNLFVPAIGIISDTFAYYDPIPFGLKEDDFINFAISQFSKRFDRLERARGKHIDDIFASTKIIIEAEDA